MKMDSILKNSDGESTDSISTLTSSGISLIF